MPEKELTRKEAKEEIKRIKEERDVALQTLHMRKVDIDWESGEDKKKQPKKKKRVKILTIICIICDLFAFAGFFMMYGPIPNIRNLYVTTASKTMEHAYLAKVFYSDKQIEKILSQNYFVEIEDNTNLDDIVINTSEKTTYKNKYEEELLTRDEGNDLYKVIHLKVGNASAYLVAIYDPTKVQAIGMKQFGGKSGERIITMCKRYGGVVCINGGRFVDYGYGSGIPKGYVIEDGKIRWSDGSVDSKRGDIIGISKEGKLMLLNNATGKEALEKGVYSGIEFGPFLIVNGKAMEIVGDPWGKAPRVAIAQRKDGVMMFLVVDGQNYINGASLQNVVDTLLLYGAYNAANLDGGQSATLIIKNKLYNNPPAAAKSTSGRYVTTGFGLIP